MAYYPQHGGHYPQQGYADPNAGYYAQGDPFQQHHDQYGHQQQHDPYAAAQYHQQQQQHGMDYGADPFANHGGYPPQHGHGGAAGYPPPHSPGAYGDDPHSHMVRHDSDAPSMAYSDPFVGSKEKLSREDGGFTNDPSSKTAGGRVRRGSVAAMMAAAGEIPKKEGLRMWRHDEHEGEFTAGGRKRMCGRCCCCASVVILLIIIGVVAGFLLWVRPPNITFNGAEAPNAPLQEFASTPGGFTMNFNLAIGVSNPNFFGAHFETVTAKAFSPANKSLPLGGGTQNNIDISSHSNTTIHFPFAVNYTMAGDPGFHVLGSLMTSCGFIGGGAKTPIDIDLALTVKVKVVAFSISPTFSRSTSFDCPIDKAAIQQMLQDSGSSVGDLGPLASLLFGKRDEGAFPAREGVPAMHSKRRRAWGWVSSLGPT